MVSSVGGREARKTNSGCGVACEAQGGILDIFRKQAASNGYKPSRTKAPVGTRLETARAKKRSSKPRGGARLDLGPGTPVEKEGGRANSLNLLESTPGLEWSEGVGSGERD